MQGDFKLQTDIVAEKGTGKITVLRTQKPRWGMGPSRGPEEWIPSWGGCPGSYRASNRSGQWGVEVGATSAPDRETANPISCPLVVSSKGSVPSFGLYQALWASTENVDRGSCTSRECRLLGWSSSIPATLCREGQMTAMLDAFLWIESYFDLVGRGGARGTAIPCS